MVLHHLHGAGSEFEHQERQNHPADQPAGKDGQHERYCPHFKDARREDEEFPGGGRRQGGGYGDGQKLLAFKAEFQALVAFPVHALEQKELAAGSADEVRQQASDGRTRCS